MNAKLLLKPILTVLLSLLLASCASIDIDKSLQDTNATVEQFTQGDLALVRNEDQRQQHLAMANKLLDSPLDRDAAVKLALINSPEIQAMLSRQWAASTTTALAGRMPNPVFEFERLTSGSELEIGRLLSVGLMDLLTLPQRHQAAKLQLEAQQIQLTAAVVDSVTEIRQAWIEAVVAKQLDNYAQQVLDSAKASAVLANQMQAIGNFSALERAKQQKFYSDAVTQLAVRRHEALASRELLVRLLGLTSEQADNLQLPERLPDIPEIPLAAEAVSQSASEVRLDVQIATSMFESSAKLQGLKLLSAVTDVEVGARRDSVWSDDGRSTVKGYEIALEVPIFRGFGQIKNDLNARSLAAANELEATLRSASSHLREAYSAYRTAHDIAWHYRNEVVPLQQQVSEENVLLYNGMIIGIFELLADSRAQIASITDAINADRQFWLAESSLQSSIVGKPRQTMMASTSAPSAGGSDAGH